MSIYQKPEDTRIEFSEEEKRQNEVRYNIVRISRNIENLTTKLAEKCVDFMHSSEYEHLNSKEQNNVSKYYSSAMYISTVVSLVNLSSKQPYDKYGYKEFMDIIFKNFHIIDGLDRIFPTDCDEKPDMEQEWCNFFKNYPLDIKSLENDESIKAFKSNHVKFFSAHEYAGCPKGKVFAYILMKIIDVLNDSYFSLIRNF